MKDTQLLTNWQVINNLKEKNMPRDCSFEKRSKKSQVVDELGSHDIDNIGIYLPKFQSCTDYSQLSKSI